MKIISIHIPLMLNFPLPFSKIRTSVSGSVSKCRPTSTPSSVSGIYHRVHVRPCPHSNWGYSEHQNWV